MPFYRTALRKGIFSLLELAVVLTVLLIVATIVAPRMTRGAASSPQLPAQVLTGQLRSLRAALTAYARDHGGQYPDADHVARQLTQFTDWAGRPNPTRQGEFRWGPYLREIPPLPVGSNHSNATIRRADAKSDPAGWLYDPRTGNITPNVTGGN
jgi:type II secretory pathway pseudopilin PulG